MIIRLSTEADTPACKDIIEEAGHDTGLPDRWSECTKDALAEGNVLLAVEPFGDVIGYFAFVITSNPDTLERVMVERMLYVSKAHRGSTCAVRLLNAAEYHAKTKDCDAILAGSSLNCNDLARRLYEARGFKTNYTFRKDIHYV